MTVSFLQEKLFFAEKHLFYSICPTITPTIFPINGPLILPTIYLSNNVSHHLFNNFSNKRFTWRKFIISWNFSLFFVSSFTTEIYGTNQMWKRNRISFARLADIISSEDEVVALSASCNFIMWIYSTCRHIWRQQQTHGRIKRDIWSHQQTHGRIKRDLFSNCE